MGASESHCGGPCNPGAVGYARSHLTQYCERPWSQTVRQMAELLPPSQGSALAHSVVVTCPSRHCTAMRRVRGGAKSETSAVTQ